MNNPGNFIDKKVRKEKKPFKSSLKENTVKGIVKNPKTGKLAFTFYEDDSVVDCDKCFPSEQQTFEDDVEEIKRDLTKAIYYLNDFDKAAFVALRAVKNMRRLYKIRKKLEPVRY